MSHHTLQRVVVRLLFDPAFVDAVRSNPDEALAGLELTDSERAQLSAVDPRAWKYDSLRRARTLRTLVEEFKISTTLVVAETRSLASLDAYFSSSTFHEAMQNRGSMGLGFAKYLGELRTAGKVGSPHFPDVLRFETTMAECRREVEAAGEREAPDLPSSVDDTLRVRLAPGTSVGRFHANLIPAIQAVEKYLFEVGLMPAMVLCDDAPRLPALPEADPKRKVYLLFSPGAAGVTLTGIDRTEYLVLFEAKKPRSIRDVAARSATAGVPAKQAIETISEALESGTLIPE